MRRLRHFADAVQALYGGTEQWYVGARHIHAHENALDRVVVAAAAGTSTEPDLGAQGWAHANLDPRIVANEGRREDVVRVRRVSVDFHVWAPDEDLAESRLHSLILAVDSLDNVEIVGERWPTEEEYSLADGGGYVILTVVVPLYVVASDEDPTIDPGSSGYGQEQITPDPVTITATLEDTALPPFDIEPET